MAEMLGVAASGIAVAQITIQVGSTVLKLKKLWEEIKDVPDDIADLMDQIDCLEPVVWEAENSLNQGDLPSLVWDSLASKPATNYCRKALRNLTAMIDELNAQISSARGGRRKLIAAKVLLKKDSLKKLEKRLENAVRMLTLAQFSYLFALTRVQPDIIIQKFAALAIMDSQSQLRSTSGSEAETGEPIVSNHPLTNPDNSTMVALSHRPYRPALTKASMFGRVIVQSYTKGYAILLQAPTWLSQRSWELYSNKAYGSWQWNIRTYSTVPRVSKVIKIAKKGSPEDLQQLCDAGLASLYDRDLEGRGLLYFAVWNANFRMVRFLFNIGFRFGAANFPLQPLSVYINRYFEQFPENKFSDPIVAKTFLALQADEDKDVQELTSECRCWYGISSMDRYDALLPYQCPRHLSTSFESRLEAAAYALSLSGDLEVVRRIIGPEWDTHPQNIYPNNTKNLILPVATAFCRHTYSNIIDRRTDQNSTESCLASDMFELLVGAIRRTPGIQPADILSVRETLIHVAYPYGRTTAEQLTLSLCWYFWSESQEGILRFPFDFSLFLKPWVEALEAAGVDLVTYGQLEHDLLVKSGPPNEMEWPFWFWMCEARFFYLVGFEFGPTPEDWVFYWNEPSDGFAGDFWNLIEDPPLHMPGSWVD
ncbi:hypothetical protein F5Y04DRAFT_291741 [Hypomontagnella monticulosa]|nr:hypothetical protein F5Y04DRAFT_291741 [Hypomontagnella monticulosa]